MLSKIKDIMFKNRKALIIILCILGFRYIALPVIIDKLIVLPKAKILYQVNPEDYIVLEKEVGFALPEKATILRASTCTGRDGQTMVCIVGIEDIDQFISDYCYIKIESVETYGYFSSLHNAKIEGTTHYTGTNTKRGPGYEKEVSVYTYQGIKCVEILTPAYYEEDTYKLFFDSK